MFWNDPNLYGATLFREGINPIQAGINPWINTPRFVPYNVVPPIYNLPTHVPQTLGLLPFGQLPHVPLALTQIPQIPQIPQLQMGYGQIPQASFPYTQLPQWSYLQSEAARSVPYFNFYRSLGLC